MTKIADTLLENREKVIQFLIENNWTIADIKDYGWETNQNGYHVFGHTQNNRLCNTKGAWINPYYVVIGYFNEIGNPVRTYFEFDESGI